MKDKVTENVSDKGDKKPVQGSEGEKEQTKHDEL
jgi:hypothetical protein|tara:strand:- start:130 stop:231 length:102 start_codon:yes stop_codon:yes gene_type:complete